MNYSEVKDEFLTIVQPRDFIQKPLLAIKKALYCKFSSSLNYYFTKDINDILVENRTAASILYKDINFLIDNEEFIKRYYKINEFPDRIVQLTEYYKFHNDIPRLFMLPVTKQLNKHHDKKRKHDYISITKMLNHQKGVIKEYNFEKFEEKLLLDVSQQKNKSYCKKQDSQTLDQIKFQLEEHLNNSDFNLVSEMSEIINQSKIENFKGKKKQRKQITTDRVKKIHQLELAKTNRLSDSQTFIKQRREKVQLEIQSNIKDFSRLNKRINSNLSSLKKNLNNQKEKSSNLKSFKKEDQIEHQKAKTDRQKVLNSNIKDSSYRKSDNSNQKFILSLLKFSDKQSGQKKPAQPQTQRNKSLKGFNSIFERKKPINTLSVDIKNALHLLMSKNNKASITDRNNTESFKLSMKGYTDRLQKLSVDKKEKLMKSVSQSSNKNSSQNLEAFKSKNQIRFLEDVKKAVLPFVKEKKQMEEKFTYNNNIVNIFVNDKAEINNSLQKKSGMNLKKPRINFFNQSNQHSYPLFMNTNHTTDSCSCLIYKQLR